MKTKQLLWKNSKITVGIILIIIWIRFIIEFTILHRTPIDHREIKLAIFWTIRDAWSNQNTVEWFLIEGNILGFVPLGILLPLFFKNMRSLWKTMTIGFSSSFCIEVVQLIERLGLFEVDDLFHNTLGTVVGYCIWLIFMCFGKRGDIRETERSVAVIVLVGVILFFTIAVLVDQPVFDYFRYYLRCAWK